MGVPIPVACAAPTCSRVRGALPLDGGSEGCTFSAASLFTKPLGDTPLVRRRRVGGGMMLLLLQGGGRDAMGVQAGAAGAAAISARSCRVRGR